MESLEEFLKIIKYIELIISNLIYFNKFLFLLIKKR